MQLIKLIQFLESIAPPQLQEDYDNAGLVVGDQRMDIEGVMVCLDSTEEVIDEAIANKCNVIVAHHPIIFRGLKKINGKNYIERTIIKAIKNDIAIYAIHTNLDNVLYNGVNQKIAQRLKLKNCKILSEHPTHSTKKKPIGAGIIGTLKSPMTAMAFLKYLKKEMHVSVVRHTSITKGKVKNIAICGGSGSFLLSQAIRAKTDVFITADFKYHEFFDANNEIIIADIGHYESEQFTIELLHELISKKFRKFAAHYTKVNTNPINYL